MFTKHFLRKYYKELTNEHSEEGVRGMSYYQKTEEETLKDLQASMDGLSSGEVNARIERDGYNELEQEQKASTLKLV